MFLLTIYNFQAVVHEKLVVREQLLGGMQKHFKTKSTVKPDLTTTCEQRPPVNNGQFESSTTSLNLSFIRQLCQTATFFRSQGWPLYPGSTVYQKHTHRDTYFDKVVRKTSGKKKKFF